MPNSYTCLAVDDDPLFLRKIEIFIEDISWLSLLESHTNPVQGATAIISKQPEIVLLDIEMPHADGNYLLDWIGPKLKSLENPPKVIVISSLTVLPEDQMPNVCGYINKVDLTSSKELEARLNALIS